MSKEGISIFINNRVQGLKHLVLSVQGYIDMICKEIPLLLNEWEKFDQRQGPVITKSFLKMHNLEADKILKILVSKGEFAKVSSKEFVNKVELAPLKMNVQDRIY